MPSTSKKQHNFMEAIAHNPSFAKKVGIPQSVGQDFSTADKGRKFAKGGDMATKGMNLFKGKETYKEELGEGKAIKSGKITPEQYAKGEESEKKMGTKKMAMGGPAVDPRMAAMLAAKLGAGRAQPAVDPRMAAMLAAKLRGAGGGGPAAPGMKNGGAVKKFAAGGFTRAADGIAQKGKTRAKQIKMAGGGKC